ncbi:MAG TPA: alpha/beta hydrolase [Anaerolineae bacterium]|nr:alpha/beta hydrolase [Anaerolineae bacterium]
MPHINNQGVDIHYKIVGEGAPLLMLHGGLCSSEDWSDFGYTEKLGGDRRLILVDLRGHGESGKPHDSRSYSIDLFVQDAIALLDELRVGVCDVLGFSIGGWVVYRLWKMYPERVRSIILMDGVPGLDDSALILDYVERLEQVASPIAHFPNAHKRFLANDKLAIQSLARGIVEDIPRLIDDINALPENINLPCLVLTSDIKGIEMDLMTRIKNAMVDGSLKTFLGFTHFDVLVRGDETIPHLRRFLDAQAG